MIMSILNLLGMIGVEVKGNRDRVVFEESWDYLNSFF